MIGACLCGACGAVLAQQTESQKPDVVLRVCADPNNLPQSNSQGEGYENKIAQALARDLNRKIQYTYFPQRIGFVRNTLRARDETTQQFKCDVIIGVPSGYELTATTQPYMRSTYAMVISTHGVFASLKNAQDLLKLPVAQLHSIRIGLFARTPAADWVLQNGLIEHAVLYPPESGDPQETAETIVERDLDAGKIDAAILWGPIAGFLVNRHVSQEAWTALPFSPDPRIRFDYEISMGVRNGETQWKDTLDAWIGAHREEITQILTTFHVPLLSASGEPRACRQ
jgi:quinoprotein dehydrogenase-associated probable ABC transporter substrate-binding protein